MADLLDAPDQTDETQPQGETSSDEAPDPNADPLEGREDLQTALKNRLAKFAGQEKSPRRTEVIEARRQRFYNRGDQYIWWNSAKFTFATATAGISFGSSSDAVEMPRYTDVYEIYGPYLDIIVALMSQNPPGVNFEPNDPTAPTDITAAQTGEKYRHYVDRVNDRKSIQAEIASKFCTDGRTVIWTRSLTDDDGNTKEIFSVYGVLEHKCAITAKNQDEMPYQIISFEKDISLAKFENQDYAVKIKQSSSAVGESAYERLARLGALQGTNHMNQAGDSWSHLVTEQHLWLRPAAFTSDSGDGTSDALLDELKELFPSGCYVKFVGEAYCGSKDQSMDDCLTVGFPRPGDGQNRPSLLKKLVAVQDAFNDYKNLEKEIYDYCQPETFVVSEANDLDALREQISQPGNYKAVVLPGMITDIRGAVMTTPAATAPASLIEAYNNLQGALAEFMTGAYPALFGGDTKQNDTAKGIGIQRDQAMARLGLPWGALQEIMAKAYKQAVIQAVANRNSEEVLHVQVPSKRGKSTVAKIPIADLSKGNFHTYPDQESSFPETTGSKRATLESLMKVPEMAPILQLPENQELSKQWMGMEDLVVPFAAAFDKASIAIDKLLATSPVPPSPQEVKAAEMEYLKALALAKVSAAPAPPEPPLVAWAAIAKKSQPGQQPPPPPIESLKPSIPIDPQCDFSAAEWSVIQDWLSSEERREQDKQGNQMGVLNVRLYGLAQKANAAAQAGQAGKNKVSESINYADLPPEGQVQMAGQVGIKIAPPAPQAQSQPQQHGVA